MATRQKRPSSGGGASKSSPAKTTSKSRGARPVARGQSGSATSRRRGKTIAEETQIGEDYESGRRDALP